MGSADELVSRASYPTCILDRSPTTIANGYSATFMMFVALVFFFLGAMFGQKMEEKRDKSAKKEKKEKRCQSQVTYNRKLLTPRFVPLHESLLEVNEY